MPFVIALILSTLVEPREMGLGRWPERLKCKCVNVYIPALLTPSETGEVQRRLSCHAVLYVSLLFLYQRKVIP